MMLLCLRGTPFLFQGEELGLPDARVPPEDRVDVDGRDPERAPIPGGPPSPGRSGRHHRHPVAAGRGRGGAPRRLGAGRRPALDARLRRLVWLRQATPALHGGGQRMLDGRGVLAWTREGAASAGSWRSTCPLGRAGPTWRAAPAPRAAAWRSRPTRTGRRSCSRRLLGPDEGVLVRLGEPMPIE